MTQEEKYRKALLEARAVLEPCLKYSNGKVREALDSIDKELKSFESEDERIMKTIRQLLETARDAHSNTSLAQPYIDALAWLEKQKEQKPASISCGHENDKLAEWSEEDRLHYVNVLEALEYVKGCKSDYNKIEAVKSDIAWLKSLRPSWKPSDMNTNCQGCLYWTGKCKLPKGLDCPERKEEQK